MAATYNLSSKITFGGHKDKTVRQVIDEGNGQWVDWADEKIEWLSFSQEVWDYLGKKPLNIPPVPAPVETRTSANLSKVNLSVIADCLNTVSLLSTGKVTHETFGEMVVCPVEHAQVERLVQLFNEMLTTLKAGQAYTVMALPQEQTTRQESVSSPTSSVPSPDAVSGWDPDDLPF